MARRTYYSLIVFKRLCIIHHISSSIRTKCLTIIRIPYCKTQTLNIFTLLKKEDKQRSSNSQLDEVHYLPDQLTVAVVCTTQMRFSMAKLEQSLDMDPRILVKKAVVDKAMRLNFLYTTQSPRII